MKLFCRLSTWLRPVLPTAAAAVALLASGAGAFPPPQWMQGGHSSRISGLACSPDGALIASSSEDGTVKLWSTNGTLLRTFTTQFGPITCVAWSPDGMNIAAGTYYGGYYNSTPGLGLTYLWHAPDSSPSTWTGNGVNLTRVSTNRFGKVTALAFTPDSARLATGSEVGSNSVTAVSDGSFVAACPAYNTYAQPAAVASVAFSPSKSMASGSEDGTVRLYDSSRNLLWTTTNAASPHTATVTGLAFSPNGSLLATASSDQTIKVWMVTGGALQKTLVEHTNVDSIAFSPDGQKIVAGCVDGTVVVWSWPGGSRLSTIPAHALPVTATLFSTDGARIISGGDDGSIRIWSVADGSLVCAMGGQNYFIGAVTVSPDGVLCASAGGNETILVRTTLDGALVRTLAANSNYVGTLAFSPDSARLASGGGPLDPTIKIWQISSGALLNTIPATTNGVMALAWSPDGLTLACGGDSTEPDIKLWDTNGTLCGTLAAAVSGHSNGVTALAFSPQGNQLASGGRRPGNMVRIWTNSTPGIWTGASLVRTYTTAATNNNVECLAFSPGGTLVAIGRTAVNVLKIGLPNGTDLTLGSGTNPVFSAAFSPDGGVMAATDQNTIQIWTNGTSWTLAETITNEAIRASCLAYSPNANFLMCGREDGAVTMFPNTRGNLGKPSLAFTRVDGPVAGQLDVVATVQPWARYIIESSTDLTQWRYLTQLAGATNSVKVSGLSTTNSPAGFIRAFAPQ